MLEYLHRKRKAVVYAAAGVVAGVTAAATLYAWNSWYENDKAIRERLHRNSNASIMDIVKETTPGMEPDDWDEFSQPTSLGSRLSMRKTQEEELSLDQSMNSHFSFVQDVSAPQHLDQLLPRLRATLMQLTDLKLLRQQQQLAGQAAAPAAEQLRLLARLSFVRALGACWLIPCMDLLVRVKLNLIARHLFLQEKLGKLKHVGSYPAGPGSPMPPRLTPAAIEAFLDCGWFARTGCRWVLDKVSEGVEVVLGSLSMETEVNPNELFQIMADMLREVEAAMLRCPWQRRGTRVVRMTAGTLEKVEEVEEHGSSGDGRAPGSVQKVDRREEVLGSCGESRVTGTQENEDVEERSGTEAVVLPPGNCCSCDARAGQTGLKAAEASAEDAGSGTAWGAAQQKGNSSSCSTGTMDAAGSATSKAAAAAAAGGESPVPGAAAAAAAAVLKGPSGNPWQDMLAGPLDAIDIRTQNGLYSSAAVVEELHRELCTLLDSTWLTEAMRAAVQHAFRAAAANIYAGFPAIHGPAATDATTETTEATARTPAAVAGSTGSPKERSLARSRDSRIFGAVPRNTFFASNGGFGVAKASRPLARVLRIVQGSGDLAFDNIKTLTKGISVLPAVMALSATAFACTSQLRV